MQNSNKIKEVTEYVKSMGMTDEEFAITEVINSNMKGNNKTGIQITFGVKGNKKIIDGLMDKGWEIDRRYKNDDGSPSIFSSDLHGKNVEHRFLMIVLSKMFDLK